MHNKWIKRMGILALMGSVSLAGATAVPGAPPLKEGALEGVTQNWDKVLPAEQRFTVLPAFNNEAVRDKETGLVWEASPAADTREWRDAAFNCAHKSLGGRKGWRLPSIPELSSLVDPSVPSPGPVLPLGHPFGNVYSTSQFWSATRVADQPSLVWTVDFANGNTNTNDKTSPRFPVWCVRGSMNADSY